MYGHGKGAEERSVRNHQESLLMMWIVLFIVHPCHELLVHGWVELAKPLVFVLTDGSGRTNQSRLKSTTEILNQTRVKRGRIYGRLTDRTAYAAILDRSLTFLSGSPKTLPKLSSLSALTMSQAMRLKVAARRMISVV